MKTPSINPDGGNTMIMALATILILSLIGANVLGNLTTRYNVSNTQVRGWKQAQQAAEAAADIAYAEIRKTLVDRTNPAFVGWTADGATLTSPVTTFGDSNLQASATVEPFYWDPMTGNPWYRIRAKGTAPLPGLKRVTMDSRMNVDTRGDSLLRKIDFNFDHFIANYGPKGDGVGKALISVAAPQISRRLELVAAPVTPFSAAIKASGTYYGLGSAAQIDSYDSSVGPYPGWDVARGTDDPITNPRFKDSQSGHVQIGTGTATVMGYIYGNLATNGGTVRRGEYVKGTIDNNVPFTLPPYKMPTMERIREVTLSNVTSTMTLTPPDSGTARAPVYYELSSFNGDLTINRVSPTADTYVAFRVMNDFRGGVTVKPGVHAQFFIEGSIIIRKAGDIVNQTGYPGNVQFYGISPTNPSTTQVVTMGPPGNFSAVIYAPSADYSMNGNPDITGALVCHNFYANGNTGWHYDRQLDSVGEAVDYRVASYVEDIR
jgi:Tfp pilus assembly protein PilX